MEEGTSMPGERTNPVGGAGRQARTAAAPTALNSLADRPASALVLGRRLRPPVLPRTCALEGAARLGSD